MVNLQQTRSKQRLSFNRHATRETRFPHYWNQGISHTVHISTELTKKSVFTLSANVLKTRRVTLEIVGKMAAPLSRLLASLKAGRVRVSGRDARQLMTVLTAADTE